MRSRFTAPFVILSFLLLIAVTSPLVPNARSESGWTHFASKPGRFSVDVPVRPVPSKTQQKSFIGTVTNHIFTATSGEDLFTVDYSDIPDFALHFAGPGTIYEHAKGALLKKTYGTQISYSDVAVGGAAGKRLTYDTPPAPGYPKMRGDAILLLVGNRLYVIDGVVPDSEADAKSQRFLSSFQITK